jgi:hypothetical protein
VVANGHWAFCFKNKLPMCIHCWSVLLKWCKNLCATKTLWYLIVLYKLAAAVVLHQATWHSVHQDFFLISWYRKFGRISPKQEKFYARYTKISTKNLYLYQKTWEFFSKTIIISLVYIGCLEEKLRIVLSLRMPRLGIRGLHILCDLCGRRYYYSIFASFEEGGLFQC